jgi:hypothetical protein
MSSARKDEANDNDYVPDDGNRRLDEHYKEDVVGGKNELKEPNFLYVCPNPGPPSDRLCCNCSSEHGVHARTENDPALVASPYT